MFTKEEIKGAKATRDFIIKEDIKQLKSVYIAGEIVMWDEINSLLKQILHMSNIEHCQSAEDMQKALEKIYDLINEKYPNLNNQ